MRSAEVAFFASDFCNVFDLLLCIWNQTLSTRRCRHVRKLPALVCSLSRLDMVKAKNQSIFLPYFDLGLFCGVPHFEAETRYFAFGEFCFCGNRASICYNRIDFKQAL